MVPTEPGIGNTGVIADPFGPSLDTDINVAPSRPADPFDAQRDPFGGDTPVTTGARSGRGEPFGARSATPTFNPEPVPPSGTSAPPPIMHAPSRGRDAFGPESSATNVSVDPRPAPPAPATAPPAAPATAPPAAPAPAPENVPVGRGEGRPTPPSEPARREPNDGGIWRPLSIVACLAAIIVGGYWLRLGLVATAGFQDSAGQATEVTGQDPAATDTVPATTETADSSIPLPLGTAEASADADGGSATASNPFNGTITVSDFPLSDAMTVGVLGSDIRTPVTTDGASVDVATPAGITTIIGLWEADVIRGMTIVNQPDGAAGPDQNTISPATTAQSLVALYPGVLTSDVAEALNRSAAVTETPEFTQLADAVRDRGGVIIDTPDIAIALSGVINGLPAIENLDPSCDTNAPDTVASGGGLCFSGDDPPLITNETNRWTIVLDATSKAFICGAVAPRSQSATMVGENCGTDQLVVGPGPGGNAADSDDDDRRAIRGAAGLHSFAEYALVLNDLIVGTAARSEAASDNAIVAVVPGLVERAVALGEADAELAEAGLVVGAVDAHADERVRATAALSRGMMLSDSPTLVGQESWTDSSFAMGLTDLFIQSTEWVSASAAIPSWTVPAATVVDVTGASGAGNEATSDSTGTSSGSDTSGSDTSGSDASGSNASESGSTDPAGGEGQ